MATQPISNLATTWNAAGTTFNAIKMNVTDTASAAGSLLLDLQVGGASQFNVAKTGLVTLNPALTTGGVLSAGNNAFKTIQFGSTAFGSNGVAAIRDGEGVVVRGSTGFAWENNTNNPATGTIDLRLVRDAANTLAQRNGTNAQAFRLYNTYTDASNYERGTFGYVTNRLTIGHQNAGTGADRSIDFVGQDFAWKTTAGTPRWYMLATGHFVAAADNTYDIGAAGANRPRAIYLASTGDAITSAGDIRLASTSLLYWASRGGIRSTADGVLYLVDNAGTSFNRLQFGGTTSAYPSLKRNGASLQLRLADDSSSADLTAAQITANASTAMPAGGAVTAGVKMSTTANFGVFFGSGAPTLSAAKGSLYLRSDGTTTNDRMYVNTDGASTWTAVTTAA
jgi:hypothetical protein